MAQAKNTAEALRPEDFVILRERSAPSDLLVREPVGYWKDAWRRLRRNKVAMTSLVVLGLFLIMIIIGPYLRGYDYITAAPQYKNADMSAQFWLGADALGRDLFSRLWVGTRVSFVIAIVCTAVQVVVGCLYGSVMAYFGGIVDEIMMRILEVITAIPSLLITILIMIALGNSAFSLLVALCIASWCPTARVVRGQIMQLRESEYVMAAEAMGERPMRIILRHLLPNIMGILILDVATSIPGYIFQEAGLSFIGLGLQTPAISLGLLISNGQAVMNSHVNQLIFPAAVLCIMVLAFNLLGDGLRNALDPKFRK
ncbi:MAG: ABC transporter permease [Oscillospiraceae bacterium]|nr:ABC transporter permease [Oscillospiraceae bacterium]